MKNIIQSYLKYKKITIPVTVVVAVLLVGGVAFGISGSSKKVDTPSVSAEKKEDAASKKKAEKKEAAKDDKKESDIKELPEAKDNKKDTKQTTTAKAETKKDDTKKTNTGSNKTSSAESGKATSNNTNSNASANNNSGNGSSTQNQEPLTCAKCGLLYDIGYPHDCPADYATDYYGNKVRADSRYVVAVGGWGCKKYSDGTYEITEEARNANRQSYESGLLTLQGAGIEPTGPMSSLNAFVIDCAF